MAHRVITRSVRGRVKPRSTQWIGSTAETAVTNLAGSSVVLDQSFPFGEDATIVRVRGKLWIGSDQASASERPMGAIGFANVTNQALAIGVTAVPTPITDISSDEWFLWAPFFNGLNFADATGIQQKIFAEVELESKAMRKVNDGLSTVVVLENASTFGLSYLMHFRMLVKLHG